MLSVRKASIRALALWLGCVACGADTPPGPSRFELRVDSLGQLGDAVAIDESALRAAIRDAVARSGSFVDPGEAAAGVMSTRVRLGEVAGPGGGRALRVAFVARTPEDYQAVLGVAVDATVELERVDGALLPEEDAPVAITRAVGVMDAKIRLLQGGEADAVALLSTDDPEIAVLVLEHVARQRWRSPVSRVEELLAHGDERVVEAAVDCLGAIGGPEHAAVLVRHVKLADRDQAQRLYEALAQLGGDEALGFLQFAAHNEDDPALAEVAAGALRRLTEGGPPPARDAPEPVHPLRGHRP